MTRVDFHIRRNVARYLISISLISLAGCGETRIVTTPPITLPKSSIFHPPLPSGPQLQPQEPWVVLTPGESTDHTIYGMSIEQYQIAATNQEKTKKYIKDLLALLQYYRGLK